LDHGAAASACRHNALSKFPKDIEDFGNAFVAMQDKRHQADYDPHAKFTKSEVLNDIALVAKAIADFETCDAKDRRAFCTFVVFKRR
jgi:hypothetical protein